MPISNNHNNNIYNILLSLSRNIFFYKKVKLPDTFETRIYLMFIHFSIFMIISKKKGQKFDQKTYDFLFHSIENNLRELGYGDVSVNKKMKDFNKILYDILLKLDLAKNDNEFRLNENLIKNYFQSLNSQNNPEFVNFNDYFTNFYNFCFDLPLNNMLEGSINYKF